MTLSRLGCTQIFKIVLRKWVDVGLLGENHQKMSLIASEDLLSNEGVFPFRGHFFSHRMVEWIDP